MVGGGVYAYEHYFHRAGEEATQLIPAAAHMVITMDLTPSPNQVPTFKQIGDALEREGLAGRLDESVRRNLTDTLLAQDLRPYLTGSMAFATLAGRVPDQEESLLCVAIKDEAQVRRLLARDARPMHEGDQSYYQISGQSACMTVIGSYLVTAETPETLRAVQGIERGAAPSVAALEDYRQARAALPHDSNLMLFVSASTVAHGVQQTGNQLLTLRNPPVQTHYMAMGMAIHPEGIDGVMLSPLDPPAALTAQGSRAGDFAPLTGDLWRRLPSGALGVVALSQPGKAYDYLNASASENAEARKAMNDAVASFERDTSLSVTRDILPATQGNVALAVYPDAAGQPNGIDGLLLLDDSNGADPSALADRVRIAIEHESGHNGASAWRFVREEAGGVIRWVLDADAQQAFDRSLSGQNRREPTTRPSNPEHWNRNETSSEIQGSLDFRQGGNRLQIDQNGIHVRSEQGDSLVMTNNGIDMRSHDGNRVAIHQDGLDIRSRGGGGQGGNGDLTLHAGQGDGVQVDGRQVVPGANQIFRNKTLAFAQVGRTVLVASSREMLERGIRSCSRGTDVSSVSVSLASDPAYARMWQHLPDGAQNATLIATPVMLVGMKPALTDLLRTTPFDQLNQRGGMTVDSLFSIFGTTGDGIVATQQYNGKTLKVTFFVPVDYAKAIHLVGNMIASTENPQR